MADAKMVLSAVDETKAAFASATASLQGLRASALTVKSTLVGLATTGAIAAFAGTIASAIEAADQINKLSQRTGIAAEALSQLQFAAKLSDVSTESLTTGLKKLNVSISEGLGGNQAKVEMFRNLGISLRDASGQAKTADKVLLEMATSFSTAKDGATKTAYAVGLLGKAGDEMIPLLNGGGIAIKDLMEKANRLGLTISTEFAKKSEEFNDNLMILKASGSKLAITLGGELVDALGDIAKKMAEAAEQGGKLHGIWVGIDEVGNKLFDWSSKQEFKGIERLRGELDDLKVRAAAIKIDLFVDKGRALEFDIDIAAKTSELNKALAAYYRLTDGSAGAGRGTMPDPRSLGSVGSIASQTKNLKPLTGGTASEYDALNKAIEKRMLLAQQQLDFGDKLPDYLKHEQESLADLWDAYSHGKITLDQLVNLEAKVNDTKATEKAFAVKKSLEENAMDIAKERQRLVAEGYAEAAKLDEENTKAAATRLKAGQDMLDQIQFDTKALTMNAQEREVATAEREMERQNIVKGTEAWDRYHDAIAKASGDKAALQKSIDDFKNVWDSVDRTAHDTFVNIFEGGKDAFTKLRDTLKSTLLDLLYQMTVKKWIFNIAASVTGQSAGVAGAVSNAAGMGNGIGGIGNLISGGTSLANMAGTSLANVTGTGLDGFLATNGAFGTAGGAMGGIMSTIGAALPYVGIALAVASMLSGSKGGPKTEGGFSPNGLNIAGVDIGGNMQGSQRGDVSSAQSISQSISDSYTTLAKQLGLVNQKLDVGVFFAKDPQGTSNSQLQITSSAGYNRGTLTGGIENVGRSDAEFQTAVTDATSQLLLEALKNSDLAAQYKQILNGIADTAGSAEIQTAIDRVTAAKTQQVALQEQLFQLTASDQDKINHQRDAERAAVDPLNAALLEQIYAQQDAAKAVADATTAAQDQVKAQDALRVATQAANQALNDAVTGAMSSYADALRTNVSDLQSVVNTQQGYADALKQFRLSLTTGPLAQLSPEAQYNATSAEFNRLSALPVGSDERMAGLQNAGQAFLQASQAYNASSAKYFIDLAKVSGSVQASEGAALTSAQIARMQLTTAQSQLDLLQGIKTNTGNSATLLSAMTSALVAQIRAGGSVGSTVNPAALAAATGGTTGVFSMVGGASTGVTAYTSGAGAFATFTHDANAVYAKDGSYVGTAASITSYIRTLFDAGNYQQIYDNARQLGISLADVDTLGGFAAGSSAAWAASKGLPSFASGGMHAGGWAMVGERGPELAYMPPARIYNAQDTRGMVGGSDQQMAQLIALLQQLLVVSAEVGRKSTGLQRQMVDTAKAGVNAAKVEAVRIPARAVL